METTSSSYKNKSAYGATTPIPYEDPKRSSVASCFKSLYLLFIGVIQCLFFCSKKSESAKETARLKERVSLEQQQANAYFAQQEAERKTAAERNEARRIDERKKLDEQIQVLNAHIDVGKKQIEAERSAAAFAQIKPFLGLKPQLEAEAKKLGYDLSAILKTPLECSKDQEDFCVYPWGMNAGFSFASSNEGDAKMVGGIAQLLSQMIPEASHQDLHAILKEIQLIKPEDPKCDVQLFRQFAKEHSATLKECGSLVLVDAPLIQSLHDHGASLADIAKLSIFHRDLLKLRLSTISMFLEEGTPLSEVRILQFCSAFSELEQDLPFLRCLVKACVKNEKDSRLFVFMSVKSLDQEVIHRFIRHKEDILVLLGSGYSVYCLTQFSSETLQLLSVNTTLAEQLLAKGLKLLESHHYFQGMSLAQLQALL